MAVVDLGRQLHRHLKAISLFAVVISLVLVVCLVALLAEAVNPSAGR
jgi:hypothetical protein